MYSTDYYLQQRQEQTAAELGTAEQDVSNIPNYAIDDYYEVADPTKLKTGQALQHGAATQTKQFGMAPREYPGTFDAGGGIREYMAPMKVGGANQKFSYIPLLKGLAMSAATGAGVTYGMQALKGNAGSPQATYGAAPMRAAGTGAQAAEKGHEAWRLAQKAGSAQKLGAAGKIGAGVGGFISGYQYSPYGAQFAQSWGGGANPFLVAGDIGRTPLMMLGGDRSEEARRGFGSRLGMIGVGAGAGAIAGASTLNPVGIGIGAIAGGVGGLLQKNPETGDYAWQEAWKYDIKPIGKGVQAMFEHGPFDKAGTLKSLTNMKNWGDMASQIGSLGGGGKNPPRRAEIERDIQMGMAKRAGLDAATRGWWEAASKGKGQDYILGGLDPEAQRVGAESGLPEWFSGEFGKHGFGEYDYGAYKKGDQFVANPAYAKELGTLQTMFEEEGGMGRRRRFFKKYLENYTPYKEGGESLRNTWKKKALYDIPSNIAGATFRDLWGREAEMPEWLKEAYEKRGYQETWRSAKGIEADRWNAFERWINQNKWSGEGGAPNNMNVSMYGGDLPKGLTDQQIGHYNNLLGWLGDQEDQTEYSG